MNESRPWLVVPVRSLGDGKRRLAPVLDGRARRQLNRRFLLHVLEQAAIWPSLGRTVVVSACSEVLTLARRTGAGVLREPDFGSASAPCGNALNAALSFARASLCGGDSSRGDFMVIPCDLPSLSHLDLRKLAAMGEVDESGEKRAVLAPDRAGTGTNGLFLPAGSAFEFHFGANSAVRHRAYARKAGLSIALLRTPGLAFDVDTPADLALLPGGPTPVGM